METELQRLERLLRAGQPRIGWASVPKSGSIPGVTVPMGMHSILVERNKGCIVLFGDGTPITSPLKVQFQRKNRYNRGRFRRHILEYEKLFTYMYLDRKGLVTVGLGHRIRDLQALTEMTFYTRGTTNKVDKTVIMTAYNAVLNSGRLGAEATIFRDVLGNNIDLDLNEIERLFDKDVAQFLKLLKHADYFQDFETYPAGAQLGMLDLAYTMGVDGFHDSYDKFHAAVNLRNWIEVANQSKREVIIDIHGNPGLMDDRNKVVRGWFLEAVNDETFFLNPDCARKKLSMVPG